MALSPMMKQYFEIKDQYKDAILFFRLGDFYEMFFDDAKLASRELELTLTARDCGDGDRAPMCGVPYHAADTYIGRLVNRGYKVVICEQMEDPATAKGLVERDIVRIVTPGTVTDTKQLDETQNNYICSLFISGGVAALCFADVSTGDISATRFEGDNVSERAANEMGVYSPREVITNIKLSSDKIISGFVTERLKASFYDNMSELYNPSTAKNAFIRRLGEETSQRDPLITSAVGALFTYLETNLRSDNFVVKNLNIYYNGQYLEMDLSTRRNLELCETMRDREKKGTLLWVLDRTKTAMGARLLRRSVEMPLVNQKAIIRRQGAVSELYSNLILRDELSEQLKSVLDLERLMTKVGYGSAGGKDLRAIASTLSVIPEVKRLLADCSGEALSELKDGIDPLDDIYTLLTSSINEDPPFSVREGGFIAAGFNAEVDRLRDIMNNAKGYLDRIEASEKEQTGIKNLKIGYNRVFGYYIEVSKSNTGEVPERYIRKQTLVNGERYITEELKKLETTILGASDRLSALEYELFRGVCEKVNAAAERIRRSASMLAELDMYLSLADAAVKNKYVRPEVTLGDETEIKGGRHPVVEQFTRECYFVPNDAFLDTRNNRFLIITGPNMAGKSTFMRQTALLCIMAQIGSFVPAEEARIGIIDKVFTRVGASDDLASGQSTFMLEMTEVANILRNATKRSLIIYDEIGRGTSTYDGMSIARAVAEYTAGKKLGAKTLFATHYHELTTLAEQIPGVVNYNIAAKKKGDSVVFLRKIVPGAADDSYGIEVAKLAGIPSEIIKRAREILSELESEDRKAPAAKTVQSDNMSIADYISYEIAEKIKSTDIDTLTPIEALNLIYELKKMQI